MCKAYSTHIADVHTECWSKNGKGREHLGDLGIDERTVLAVLPYVAAHSFFCVILRVNIDDFTREH
jgi:hypothetical protein